MKNFQLTTPIVYYGGKSSILHHMLPMVPKHDCYTETFMGGGTLFWAKDPVKNETINDRSDIVINFYRVLKNDFKKLHKLIDQSLMSRSLNRYGNTLVRKHIRGEKVDKIELAWAFWFTTNFNYSRMLGAGMLYTNHQSTPAPDTMQNKKKRFTISLLNRLEHCYIENEQYLKILRTRNTANAFHYLDPPYFYGKQNIADHGHYKKMFTLEDYEQMLTWCAREVIGKFMISNYDSEMLDRFINTYGWNKIHITHRRKAPRNLDSQKVEVLITNYDVSDNLKLF